MTTRVAAIYENGVFKPQEPVALEEKARVRLVIEPATESAASEPADWEAIDRLIGFIKDGPEEPIGRDHDEVVYSR